MSETVFTKIRKGEIPGEIIFQDDKCFAFLTIEPHNPGHVLLVPVEEIADWQDLDPEVFAHIMKKAQIIAKVIKNVYNPPKVALAAVGFEVSHVHIHIFSLFNISDINHDKAKKTDPASLKLEADKIRAGLKGIGLK